MSCKHFPKTITCTEILMNLYIITMFMAASVPPKIEEVHLVTVHSINTYTILGIQTIYIYTLCIYVQNVPVYRTSIYTQK